jgi:2,3-bisphosphoglycerate-dependent phosphoglycerate mutase
MEDEITIYFMRHGRSRADDEGVHEGRYDSPLTDVGRSQIEKRAAIWNEQGVRFDCIVSSTLMRASESAKIVGGILNTPVEVDDVWMEMDNRPPASLPFDIAAIRYPKPDFRNPYYEILSAPSSPLMACTALVCIW